MNKPSTTSSEQLAITLPCSFEDFGDFVRSLLGKPQSITNFFGGQFDLNREAIEGFYHLINDRVKQQNRVKLEMFSIRIVYDDASTVELNSFETLKEYIEVRPLVSKAAHLTWEYLVKFEDRESPEKQQINVSIVADSLPSRFDAPHIWVGPAYFEHGSPGIGYRINHTARSWGSDIDALLSSHIRSVLLTVPVWKRRVREWGPNIGLGTFIALFLSGLFTWLHLRNEFWIKSQAALREAFGKSTLERKLDVLGDFIATGASDRFTSTLNSVAVVGGIVAVALSIWVGISASHIPPSFVTLTRKSEEYRTDRQKASQNRFTMFLASVIFAIITGIAGNWLFLVYFQNWAPSS